jgi:arabinogalactan oligomer/maltooligosaccharide transport system permease protein
MLGAVRMAPAIVLFTWHVAASSSATLRVTLWHSYRDAERHALELAAREAGLRLGCEMALLAVPHDAFPRKLAAAIPRGHGPDLFVFAHERIGEWARSGRIAPMAPRAAGDFLRETLPPLTFEGRSFGLPLAFKSLALFYRTDRARAPPRDTDELERIARANTDPAKGRFGLAYESGSIYHHAPWLHGFGGAMFDEAGRPALASEAFAASLAYARRLTRELGVVPPEPSGSLVATAFNEGRSALAVNGPWFIGEIRRGIPFSVAPMPIVSATGRPAAPFLTVEAVFLSARARDPVLAVRAAHDLAGAASARLRALVGRQAVAHREAWEDPRVGRDPILSAFRAQLASAVPMPNRPEMNTLWEPAAIAIRQVLRGDAEPLAAARRAQRRAEDLLRPPPAPAPAARYAAVLGALALGGAVWLAWRVWGRRGEIRRAGRAYRLLAPAALAVGVLVVLPAVLGLALAFFEHRGGAYTFVGLENFWEILTSPEYGLGEPWNFYTTLAVTTLWTALNVALHVAIGVALALWLSRPWLRLRGLFRVLLILPWAVPNYITALLWKGMFHAQFGAVNEVLQALGVEPISWFAAFWPAFTANLVTNVWLGFPFMMVVTLGALQSIPQEVLEAAAVDGATPWQRFRRVTLPLLRPALVPAVVLGTVWTFNMFNVVWLVSGGEPDGATDILVSEAYRWAFARGERYGYAAAYAVLIFLLLLGYSRLTRRWGQPEAAA